MLTKIFYPLGELASPLLRRAFASTRPSSIVRRTAASANVTFSSQQHPAVDQSIPSILWSIQFASRLTLGNHPTLLPLFDDLLRLPANQDDLRKKVTQLKATLQTSGLDEQKKRTVFSLIHDLGHLLHCLRYHSNQQILESMSEIDSDRNLARLRLEQVRLNPFLKNGKQPKDKIQCIITPSFLASQKQNNDLATSFTHTFADHLNSVGIRTIASDGEALVSRLQTFDPKEQAGTLLVIPTKRHFSLSYLENRSAVEQFMQVLQASQEQVVPLWLDLSEGNTKTSFPPFKKRERTLECRERSYSQTIREIAQQSGNSLPILPKIYERALAQPIADTRVYQSCTPRLDALTTDLYLPSSEGKYDFASWSFIQRYPLVWDSVPSIHPDLIKRNMYDPSFCQKQYLTLTQFYQHVIASAIDDNESYIFCMGPSRTIYQKMSILGRLALFATLSNRRHIRKSNLESILTKDEVDSFESFAKGWQRWQSIIQFSKEQEAFYFSYLIYQEYLTAHAISQMISEAEKEPERYSTVCQMIRDFSPNPQYELIWRFTAGHLIHQEVPLKRFFLQLSHSINDPWYTQYLFANCLIECNSPTYLSNEMKKASTSNKIDGTITSWLLEGSKELLLKEPKLWLTVLSIHAKILIEHSKIEPIKLQTYLSPFGTRDFEWPQEQLIYVLEGLTHGYPEQMVPLLKQTLSTHVCSHLRSALVKTMGRLALAQPHFSDLIVHTIYHDPSDYVRVKAVEALSFVCEKYPDRGIHLLQQLASIPDYPCAVRKAALKGLGRLHPSLYVNTFSTIKQIILTASPKEPSIFSDPFDDIRAEAIHLLDLDHPETTQEACAILHKIIASETTHTKLKQAALLKIYPQMKPIPHQGIAILRDLCALREQLNTRDEKLIFEELNFFSKVEPLAVIQALQVIFSKANNSVIIEAAAQLLGGLGQRFPDEVLACYEQVKSDAAHSSFQREYANSILLEMGKHSPQRVFPLLIECSSQEKGKLLWTAIRGIGQLGDVNPNLAFDTLKLILARNQDDFVIDFIAAALGHLGVNHPLKAIILLKEILQNDNIKTSIAPSHALTLIHNHHPETVESHLGYNFQAILKERTAFFLKELETQLDRMKEPFDEYRADYYCAQIRDLLALNLSTAPELFSEIAASLLNKKHNAFRTDPTQLALCHLLSKINQSDPLFAHSLCQAVQAVNGDLSKELKESLGSEHRNRSFFSPPIPLKIKISSIVLDPLVDERYLKLFRNIL